MNKTFSTPEIQDIAKDIIKNTPPTKTLCFMVKWVPAKPL